MDNIIIYLKRILICVFALFLAVTGSFTVRAVETEDSELTPQTEEQNTEETDEIATSENNGTITKPDETINTDFIGEDIFSLSNQNYSISADYIDTNNYDIGLFTGESMQLTYKLYPSNSDEKPVFTIEYFDSGNCGITLDENGNVTAISPGMTHVKATIANGNSVSYYIYVISQYPDSISPKSSLYRFALSLSNPPMIGFNYYDYDSRYCRKHVVSDNPDVAVPDEEWTYYDYVAITPKSEGRANITVTADNGVSVTALIEVADVICAHSIISDEKEIYLKPGNTKQISYQLLPSDANEIPTFYSDNEGCATVDENGLITAVGAGSTLITAQLANGNPEYYHVYVSYEPESMSFRKKTYTGILNQSAWLNIDYTPWDAYSCRKHVVSSNPSVVQVNSEFTSDSSIYVSCVGVGSSTITVTTDSGLSCETTVTVVDGDYAEYIGRDNWDTIYVPTGQSRQLEYTLSSGDDRTEFADEKVTWTVSEYDSQYISVDENGIVTALKGGGFPTVTAEITNGNSISFNINTYDLPESIVFDKAIYNVNLGSGNTYVYAHGTPSAASNCPLTYSIVHTNIAEMEGNRIIPKSTGKTMIFATAENGVYASAELNIRDGNYADGIRSVNSVIYLQQGETIQLEYELFSNSGKVNFSDETIIFRQTNGAKGLVSVNEIGELTAGNMYGNAQLMAEISNGQACYYSVYVCPKKTEISFDESKKYLLSTEESNLNIADYLNLPSDGNLYNGIDYSWMEFESSNQNVISTISGSLNIKGPGKTIITGRAKSDSSVYAEHEFEVYEPTIPVSISAVSALKQDMFVNCLYKLNVEYEPYNSSQLTDWVSSNSDVAEIFSAISNSVIIKTNSVGSVILTASSKSKPSLSVSFEINVRDGIPSAEAYEDTIAIAEVEGNEVYSFVNYPEIINPEIYYLRKGTSYWFSENISIKECMPDFKNEIWPYWQSSEYLVMNGGGIGSLSPVDQFYALRFVASKTGEVNYQVYGRSIRFIIVDTDEILLNTALTNLKAGEKTRIVSSTNPQNQNVTWSSSDDDVAVVDQNGVVTGIGGGTAIITASAGGKESSIEINVSGDPFEIPLSVRLITEEEIYVNEPTVLRAEASGGTAPYTYKFTAKINGKWVTIQNGESAECEYTFTETGSYLINVTVMDESGEAVKVQKTVTVTEKATEPLTARLVPAETIYAGEETILKAEAAGGTEPYTYKFTAKINGRWITIQNGESAECEYTFEEPGTYSVNVTVSDSAGDAIKSQKTVTVTNKPSEEPLTARLIPAETIYAGEESILKAEAAGGTEPYRYQFTVKIDGVWQTIQSGTESECRYTFEEPGSYSMNVTVTDAAGTKVKSQKTVTVTNKPSGEPLTATLNIVGNAYAGEETVLKAEAAGGAEPYTYKFTMKIDGAWQTIQSGAESECRYTFEEPGSYSVSVTVTDAAGTKVKSQKTVTVTNKPSGEPLTATLGIVGTAYAGEETILKAEAAGGAEPYTYKFTVKIDGVWQTIQNGAESECSYVFAEAGTYSVSVTVTDEAGTRYKAQKKVTVKQR